MVELNDFYMVENIVMLSQSNEKKTSKTFSSKSQRLPLTLIVLMPTILLIVYGCCNRAIRNCQNILELDERNDATYNYRFV